MGSIFIFFLYPSRFFLHLFYCRLRRLDTSEKWCRRSTMSMVVFAGILLVFLLLGYLIYALVNAETF
ncbi:hypothetical protein BL250_07515 [Erwinia sp. OLTSP20]|nr:hypothetical protein BV501_08630 [Erwinia sp. OAMSP11]PIJ72518.1 hypothetical protein BK416_09230 [Erwinia sp. OLSSP12]PIJ81756.1 hypothetical protein BLD47_08060 [Erwinia sp. OLCASP19]PIJ84349.1 hypothetical protein BLD46_08150 [Erwinia sp. OLMTSP26]PIJ86213.1 hypothetical protein BLD49_08760 [Erwinia sp. OLMDSP33]PIJ89817.1 hypothetical protein BL249_15015 [Erwinia sp. OLFS4]PIJ93088.1 hypothetical protein BL250_07515 [Erwinia sp. OLTSP20]